MDRFEQLVQELRRAAPGLELRERELLSRHTSFRIGGPARLMALPRTEQEAAAAVRTAAALEVAPFFLGNGSNILFGDAGYRGAVLDVAVDLRPASPTYKQWVAVELSEENKRQLLIPRGFGHGFVTLTDHVECLYKADNYYAPEADGGIRWNDLELAIDWGVEHPILSQKDENSPWLKDAETGF